jgi:DNA-binding XRE family transcriptional regulator
VGNRRKAVFYKDSALAKAFGRHFKELRMQKGVTQTELSYEADIDRSTIIRIETGKLNPTLDLVFILSKALEVHPGELLNFNYKDD